MSADLKDGWEGLLDPDENILWQGAPEGGLTFSVARIGETAFGALFAGFALFWMVMAAQSGDGFWAFGLIHFSVGAGLVVHGIFWPAYLLRHTFYTLTNRRAFIATQLPLAGRRLKSYPIAADKALVFDDGDPASIYFAQERVRRNKRTTLRSVGFQRIAEGRKVFGLMRDVQRSTGGGPA